MSRDAAVIEISSESDSDIECSADYPNPFDANSKIEVIDDEDDDDDTSDDDDVKIVSITPPAAPLSIAAPAPPAPAPVKTEADRQIYFAPKNGLLRPWRKCQIVSENGNTVDVQFSGEHDVCSFPRYQIALDEKPRNQLFSGTRALGTQMSTKKNQFFYAGVIGETIRRSNDYHYLIFFDNGRVDYVHPAGVRVVDGDDCWHHVHENARRFMRYCFEETETSGERMVLPIILDSVGDRVLLECDGHWQYANIENTRGESLLLLRYESNQRTEWIYRGSPRFSPIYRKYLKVQDVNPEMSLLETYSSLEDSDTGETHESPSTSFSGMRTPKKGTRNRIKRLDPVNQKAYQPPVEYRTHECSPVCSAYDAKGMNLKRYGPLALPMIMGWTRSTVKRTVGYTTPCGKVMRNINDLRRYLQNTKCQLLDVDNFSYDHRVDCLRGYETNDRHILCKDISLGVEAKPIIVTNEYNTKMPEKFTYVTKMCVNRNVPDYVNEHVDSMSCCDCSDDCYDRFECPCWQLTMTGLQFTDTPVDQFGYQSKRLGQVVATAIYECNVNCKCSKKCSNRVAQLPVSHKLELFKTRSCGWGVRCRNDIPGGAFICCYFGDLMTEEYTEHVAKKYGDTYLAQLNFIEFGEEYKEGYESHPRMSPSSLFMQSECDSDKVTDRPPTKKARPSLSNENSSEVSSTGSSSMSSSIPDDIKEPDINVINYFPRMDPATAINPTRKLFGRKGTEYIIDGKRCGNIGRFFNHSCEPNMFLQNVFIDTHDLRFPRLALFTTQPVMAGTELKWDYNYVVDSVPNREIKCECGTKQCRGRLL